MNMNLQQTADVFNPNTITFLKYNTMETNVKLEIGKKYFTKNGAGEIVEFNCTSYTATENVYMDGGLSRHIKDIELSPLDFYKACPDAYNSPERINWLKEQIQSRYDKENWCGLNSHERLCQIAAKVELLGYGINFEPDYNCPA